jgi:hypothetical protein
MEILMAEAFAKINPTRNKIDPIPPVFRWQEPKLHGEHAGIIND